MNAERKPQTVRVVLLDVDGTLLDSNDAHALSWVETLEAHGFQTTYETVRPLIGMGGDKVVPLLTGHSAEGKFGQDIAQYRQELFTTKYLAHLKPTNGAREMVEQILKAGLQPIVATSAGRELSELLKMAGVDDLLPMRTTSDDAKRSKPDADIICAALKKADAAPSHAVMIGDTPYDAKAATQAGVLAINMRCGGWWSDADLAGASFIYDDPAELVARWATSPLAPSTAEQ